MPEKEPLVFKNARIITPAHTNATYQDVLAAIEE